MKRTPARLTPLLAVLALVAGLLPAPVAASPAALASETPPAEAAFADAAGKLRGDLAALVAGESVLDPRIAELVSGYQDGEIPYFVYLTEPNDAAHRAVLVGLGARVLRTYRSVPVFAMASSPTSVLRVAAQPWVAWLAPIELVVALDEPVVDQSRATTADVGAPPQWAAGVTGTSVRIAVLDTGVDRVHPDLDDLDFGNWSSLLNAPKVVEARDFNGGGCAPFVADGHGHGTHVAGIATGTGEGTPSADDNGRYAGIAPGAELAVGKVLTDVGAGINSDLIAAMEWAAMPDDPADLTSCSIGADIVNLSLGSEARPARLNSDSDVDMVSLFLNRLAVQYGTLFVVAAGNSGPYIGSVLEAPGSAAQALSVAAAAKDWDVNHDDTLSGDTCAGWQHPPATNEDDDCSGGVGTQPPSVSSFSSRGPSGDVWLRPDLAAPGYNIVSAQSTTGAALLQNDLSPNTRTDPLYATATGTSMAAPATAGSAALLLDAYRQRYGMDPTGASGVMGLSAPAYALLRAALMNSAGGDLYESRWILSTDDTTRFDCPDPDPLFGLCAIAELLADTAIGSLTLYHVRNRATDPYVGPLAEGAGKLQVGRAIAALRDGLVVYSAASGSGPTAGTGHRDLQGSWQVGAVTAGSTVTQRFVLHAAPTAGAQKATFAFDPSHPSDGSRAIPMGGVSGAWSVTLPGKTTVLPGGNATVNFSLTIPAGTPAGTYTGIVRITTTAGQAIRVPVFASVALHDPDAAEGNAPGPQARVASGLDVFAKDDTIWPSAAGAAPTGSNADWLVFPVELAAGLTEARFSVFDAAVGNETYDLYLYDSRLDLISSTHPFLPLGDTTDHNANAARGPSTAASPQVLSIATPASGRHYVVVSRARIGGTTSGDFGAFVMTLDEIGVASADLVVSDITTLQNTGNGGANGQPKAGDKVIVRATVTNEGSAAAGASETTFELDGTEMTGSPVATGAIQPGGSVPVELIWDTRGLNGDHTITVTADSGEVVTESNEDNTSTLTVSVRGNKVSNGDFTEPNAVGDGPEAWSGSSTGAGSTSYASSAGAEGSQAATITGTGGSVALAGMPTWSSDPIAVTPGQVLSLRASVSSSGLSSAPAVGLAYLGPAGELLNTVRLLEVPLSTSGFTTLEKLVTQPPGVTQLRVVLLGFSPGDLHTAGSVTFDDIGLYEE
ncbi:MAG TPA: S8 family serine peptidase [Candidatus Limnocylindria bacterium]